MMKNFREYCLPKSNVDLLLKKAMAGDLGPLEDALVDFFSELSMKKSKPSSIQSKMMRSSFIPPTSLSLILIRGRRRLDMRRTS